MVLHKITIMQRRIGENLKSVLATVLYGACSVCIVIVNKMLMTSYEFDFPVFIMASQMFFTVLLLETLKAFGYVVMPTYSFERAKDFALASMFYGINSVLALSALNHMNIALYGVLKRCVPVVTMVLSVIILRKGWPSKMTICSVFLLTIGCIIAGYGDLKFNLYGYMCGAFSNVTQAVYLLLVQQSVHGKLSTVESLQLNSYNTLPFLAIFCIVKGELPQIMQYSNFTDLSFIVIYLLTVSLGCLLNYSLFLCTQYTSALTTSVVGGVKAIVQTVVGLFTFGGVSHNLATYVGVSTSICGGIGYIVAKHLDSYSKTSIGQNDDHVTKNGPVTNGHISNGDVVNSPEKVVVTIDNDSKR